MLITNNVLDVSINDDTGKRAVTMGLTMDQASTVERYPCDGIGEEIGKSSKTAYHALAKRFRILPASHRGGMSAL